MRIERAKILKKQLIEIDGNRLIVTGAEEVRNGTQLFLSQNEQALLRTALEAGNLVDGKELDCLIYEAINRGNKVAQSLLSRMQLENKMERIVSSSIEEKESFLVQLIRIINAANRQIDLSAFGGAKTAGQYKVNFSKELSDSGVAFAVIDQSATGMFERRTRIGL